MHTPQGQEALERGGDTTSPPAWAVLDARGQVLSCTPEWASAELWDALDLPAPAPGDNLLMEAHLGRSPHAQRLATELGGLLAARGTASRWRVGGTEVTLTPLHRGPVEGPAGESAGAAPVPGAGGVMALRPTAPPPTGLPSEEDLHWARGRVLEMTVRGEALPDILNEVARLLEGRFPAYRCAVMLEDDGRLYTAAAPSLPLSVTASLDGLPVHEASGACGAAAARGERVVIEDTLTHPDCLGFAGLAEQENLRAVVSTPVQDGRGMSLGTVSLYATQPGPFLPAALTELDRARQLVAIATEHHHLAERLVQQARTDSLTGLANRTLLLETLARVLQGTLPDTPLEQRYRWTLLRGERTPRRSAGTAWALLTVDVDDFKSINDHLGHSAGDEVLRELARRLERAAPQAELVARVSGDEFGLVLAADEPEARRVAARCREAVGAPLRVAGRDLFVTGSLGLSVSRPPHVPAAELQRQADQALLRAKHLKTGTEVYHAQSDNGAQARFELTSELRRALARGELEVHYQQQFELAGLRPVGAEALVRWRHPDRGLVSPATFIPLAEETGLIVPLGEWVLAQACEFTARAREAGREPSRVAVNVSALQFDRPDFVEMVAGCLERSGLAPSALELELTERTVTQDSRGAVRRMEALRELGVSMSIDDFGTGYSSLASLARLPINVLKIDRSFVRDLGQEGAGTLLVRTILGLAQTLGLHTVAEGIETPEQLSRLRELGCEFGQGFLLGAVRCPEEFPMPGASEQEPGAAGG